MSAPIEPLESRWRKNPTPGSTSTSSLSLPDALPLNKTQRRFVRMSSLEPGKKRVKKNPEKKRMKKNPAPEPLKKRMKKNPMPQKNPTPESSSISILSLPDELLVSCIARVSRLYYRTLSLVSKRFRSLVASPELYKMRSLSGRTESCLYVGFDCSDGCSRWFTLSRNPDNRYVLTIVATAPNSCARFSSLVAVGSDIYNIAECQSFFSDRSSTVSILDCRSHTWRQGPSFPVELRSLTASVVGRKIYVAGRYVDGDTKSCPEKLVKVLDTETQTSWDHVPIPRWKYFVESACIDGKFHLVTNEGLVAYEPKEGRWRLGCLRDSHFLFSGSYCGIGNVLYRGCNGWLRWYDSEARRWRDLKGLVGLPKIPTPESASCGLRLADYGGKLALLWEEHYPDCNFFLTSVPSQKKMIWCAVIALERHTDGEIWGEVEWCDRVLDVPRSSCKSLKALAATV